METLAYIMCLLVTGVLLFLSIYFIITLSDLECDYLNATECCDRLNVWIIPRIIGTSTLLSLYIFVGNWYLAAANLAITGFLVYQKVTIPRGNTGVYDPTEIHNRRRVRKNIQQCFGIIAWFLLSFFMNMYLAILSILKGEDDLFSLETDGTPLGNSTPV